MHRDIRYIYASLGYESLLGTCARKISRIISQVRVAWMVNDVFYEGDVERNCGPGRLGGIPQLKAAANLGTELFLCNDANFEDDCFGHCSLVATVQIPRHTTIKKFSGAKVPPYPQTREGLFTEIRTAHPIRSHVTRSWHYPNM
jgi:hypothetical protein